MSGIEGAPRLLLVGCGNMGRAILDGWLASGTIGAETVTVLDPVATAMPAGVRLLSEPPLDERFNVVVLAIKPQGLEGAAPALEPLAGEGTVLLSILAGAGHDRLRRLFPRATVLRFMGNLAAAYGLSPIAVHAATPAFASAARELVEHVLRPLGEPEWLEDEQLLHAVTALGGSGPGFVYRFLGALAKSGEALGLSPAGSAAMALATVRGAAELAARSGEDFGGLARRVASPGGTTEAGLRVLEDGEALDQLVAATLRAARDRSEELARG